MRWRGSFIEDQFHHFVLLCQCHFALSFMGNPHGRRRLTNNFNNRLTATRSDWPLLSLTSIWAMESVNTGKNGGNHYLTLKLPASHSFTLFPLPTQPPACLFTCLIAHSLACLFAQLLLLNSPATSTLRLLRHQLSLEVQHTPDLLST